MYKGAVALVDEKNIILKLKKMILPLLTVYMEKKLKVLGKLRQLAGLKKTIFGLHLNFLIIE